MKRVLFLLIVTMLAVGCSAQPDQVGLVENLIEAMNTQELETAISLFSDNAIIQYGGISQATGLDQITDWLYHSMMMNTTIEVQELVENQGQIGCSLITESTLFSFHGVGELSGSCVLTISDGKIQEWTVEFDPESKEKLFAAMPTDPSELIEIWSINYNNITVSPEVPSDWWYLGFAENGTARWGHTPESMGSEVNAENPGVWLEWTLEGGVLRLKNMGDDTEPYCQADDVGIYLVKILGSDDLREMKLKVIEDTCLARDLGFASYGTKWKVNTQ